MSFLDGLCIPWAAAWDEEEDTEQNKTTQIKSRSGFLQYSELMDLLIMSVIRASALFSLHKQTLAHVWLNLNHSILNLLNFFIFIAEEPLAVTLFWPLWLCFGEWCTRVREDNSAFFKVLCQRRKAKITSHTRKCFQIRSMWV